MADGRSSLSSLGIGGSVTHRQEVEQPSVLGAGVLVEQAEHDLSELRAGVFGEVFEGKGTGDDLAAGVVAAGLIFLAGLDGPQLAIEAQLLRPDLGLAFFECSKLFVIGHTRHDRPPNHGEAVG